MTPRLHATIMLWSASTDPVRQRFEEHANQCYAAWQQQPNSHWFGKKVDDLRDALNALVNHHDAVLLYEGEQVVGIRSAYLADFREWCALYGMDSGGL